jgi:TolB-like protein/tetratricopeptide (TPR) repeat protein
MSLVAELKRRNVVRVAAAYLVVGWLLTEVLTAILPILGAPEWAARAVILIFAFGFIPAVVFSWFYELTPEGIKREEDVVRDDKVATGTLRKLDYVTVTGVIILIVFVGLFSAQQAGDDSVPTEAEVSDASVAVLPFENMSNDKDNEYFSDGLTETLLHMLAQVPELKVAARTSSFAFKGQNINIREIAAALGVAHVLEGSVQRQGDRVRITAQLIRASDGFHVWSESYDRTLDDIFGIQDEIATRVGDALSASLLGVDGERELAGVQTNNPDAYDLYMQARKARQTFSFGGLRAAEDLLKGALLIDPDFLEAKTELAAVYFHQLETGLIDTQYAVTQIMAVTDQVLAVQPDNAVARATQLVATSMLSALSGDITAMSESIPELEAIVAEVPEELQPRILLVRTYRAMRQTEKVIPVLEDALERDPLNPQILYELGTAFLHNKQPDEARAALEKSLEIEPLQPNGYTYLGDLDRQDGDGVAYTRNFLKALEVDAKDHELPGILAVFLYRLNLTEQGDDFRDRVLTLAPTSEVAYRIELLRAIALGDEEGSVASARRAIEDDVDDRRYAYGGAVQYLLRHAIRNGTVDEELLWLNEQAPGIFDFEAESVSQKFRALQGLVLDAWYTSLPRGEFLERLDSLLEIGEARGYDPTKYPMEHANILAMRGEIEKAVDIALETIFTQSVAVNLGWRENFSQPHLAAVVADPRIQAAMQRWEMEEEQLRSDVQAYLADLQSSS